jgi:hypothetical protein
LIQASFETAGNCPPGANGSTVKDCALAAGSIISACLGIAGIVVSTKLLRDARSNAGRIETKLNKELYNKLRKHTRAGPGRHAVQIAPDTQAAHEAQTALAVRQLGQDLISRFAQLSDRDQKILREYLSQKVDDPVEP